MIKKEGSKYSVWSEDGKKRLGKPGSKAQATKRLKQVEWFKHHPEKSYSEFTKKAVSQKKLKQHVKEDGKHFDDIKAEADKISRTAREMKQDDKRDFKKSYAEFLNKSVVTDHIDQNTTIPTKQILKDLGLDYKKFMGLSEIE